MILGIIRGEGMRIIEGGWKSTTWSRRALSSGHDDAMKEHKRQRKSDAFRDSHQHDTKRTKRNKAKRRKRNEKKRVTW